MSGVSSQNERKQLEEDIERIKSTLQHEDDEEEEDVDDDGEYIVIDETLSSLPAQPYSANTEWDVASEASTSTRATTSKNKSEGSPGKASIKAQIQHEVAAIDENDALPQMCLALNKAYQEIIMENLENIQLMLARNKTKQDEIQAALTEEMAYRGLRSTSGQTRKQPFSFYGFPFFRDKSGFPPPMNEDTKARAASHEISGYTRVPRFWKNKEKATLKRAVQEDKLKQKLRPLLSRKEVELEKVETAKTPEAVEQAETRIRALEDQITVLRNNAVTLPMSEEEKDNIDWMKISIVDFDGTRDPEDIRLYWKNAMQPSINTSRWRMAEDLKLARVVEETGGRDWTSIAKALDTNRTSFQCLQRFQTKLNPCLVTGKWTEEEDTFLKEVVDSVSVNDQTPWDQVAYYMEGRSDEQCEERWKEREDLKMGRWTAAEDQVLVDAVKRCGYVWVEVQKLVPNRSAPQCRERYSNALNVTRRTGTYSYSEDRTLWQMVPQDGVAQWAKIASCIPGRTDNSCLQRYKVLQQLETLEKILQEPPYGPEVVDKLIKLRAHQLMKAHQASQEDAAIKHLEKHILACGKRIDKLEALMDSDLKTAKQPKKGVKKSLNTQRAKDQEMRNKLEELREAKNSRQPVTKDAQIMLDDRINGIIVPIPLLGDRALGKKFFSSGDVKNSLPIVWDRIDTRMRHIDRQTWRDIGLSSDKALKELLLEKHIQTTQEFGRVQKPTHRRSKPRRPRIIKVESPTKINVSPAVPMQLPPLRPSMRLRAKEKQINDQICDLLKKSQPQHSGQGRPKNYYAPDTTESGMGSTQVVEGKVIKLFAKALNMDVEGTKNCSQKLLQHHSIDLTQPMKGDLFSDTEHFNLEKNLRQLKGSLWKDVELEPTEAPNKSSEVIQRMLPRYTMTGTEAVKAYNLPPLPPSVCTLRAFRTLLLDRKNLVKRTKLKLPRRTAATKRKVSEVHSPAQGGSQKKPRTDERSGAIPGEEILDTGVQLSAERTVDAVGASVNSGGAGTTVVADQQHPAGYVPAVAPVLFTSHGSPRDSSTPNHPNMSRPIQTDQADKRGKVLVLKGSELTTEAIARALRAQGIMTDTQKLRMKILNKRDLAVKLPPKATTSGRSSRRNANANMTIKSLRQMHDYQLLKARFKSMFLWPAFLSTIHVQAKQPGSSSAGGSDTGEVSTNQDLREHTGGPDTFECEVKPLILGAQRLETKKTKKLKTVRNRYPCQYGKRARKLTVMRREQKLIAVQRFKKGRARMMQEDEDKVIDLPETPDVVKVVTKSEIEDNTDSQDSIAEVVSITSPSNVHDPLPEGQGQTFDTAMEPDTISLQDSNDSVDNMPSTTESNLNHSNENQNTNSDTFQNIPLKGDIELSLDTRNSPDVVQSPSHSSIDATFTTPLPIRSTGVQNFLTPRPSQTPGVQNFLTPSPSQTPGVQNFLTPRPSQTLGVQNFLTPRPSQTLGVQNFLTPRPSQTLGVQNFLTPRPSQTLGVQNFLTPRPSQTPGVQNFLMPRPSQTLGVQNFLTPRPIQKPGVQNFLTPRPSQTPGVQNFLTPRPNQTPRVQNFLTPRPNQKPSVCKFFTPRPSSVCSFLQPRPKKSPGVCKFFRLGPKKSPQVRNSPSVVPNSSPSLRVCNINPSLSSSLHSTSLGSSQMPYVPGLTNQEPTQPSVYHTFPNTSPNQLHTTGVYPVSTPTPSAFHTFPNSSLNQLETSQTFPTSGQVPPGLSGLAMETEDEKPLFGMQIPQSIDCSGVYPHSSGEVVYLSGSSSPSVDSHGAAVTDTKEVMYVIVKNEVETSPKDLRDRSTAINGQFSNYTRVDPPDPKH